MTWSITVPGIPKSARPGTLLISRSTGRPFLRKRNTAWAQRIADAAAASPPPALLEGPLRATLTFRMPRPTTGKAAKRPHPCVKPDVERLASGCLDQLQGIVYRDDAQIVSLLLVKQYEGAPGVTIGVSLV